jgi:hypothetical protein
LGIPPGGRGPSSFLGVFALIFVAQHAIRLPRIRRLQQGPDFPGPALMGTARVLSVAANDGQRYLGLTKVVYRIALRVQVPGHQPYDAIAREVVPDSVEFLRLPNRIVAVQVDSTDPHKVRIDFSQPIT